MECNCLCSKLPMELARIILLLAFTSFAFSCTCVQGRHHHKKHHPKHSIALPPMADPPSEPPEPMNSTDVPPALSPQPIATGPDMNSTNSTSPPPHLKSPIGAGSSGNSTNSTNVPVPFPPAPAPIVAGTDGNSSYSATIFDVRSFGAVGDGVSDDTEAFKNAWVSACQAGSAVLLSPQGYSFKIRSAIFTGPCQSGIVFQVHCIILVDLLWFASSAMIE